MDGVHDLGGMHGFGPVEREPDEPVFHARWEARVFALTSALPFAVPFGDDHFRREMERMAPADYLSASYYERWLAAIIALLDERGVLDPSVLDGAAAAGPLPDGLNPPLTAAAVRDVIAAGASQAVADAPDAPHRFRIGDRVRTLRILGPGHTRLPRYVRGRIGRVVAERGCFIFADANAAGSGPAPQQLYSVEFDARELWSEEAAPMDTLRLDLWDSYLEPVS